MEYRDCPLSLDIETANLGDFEDLSSFVPSCICVYDPLLEVDYIFVDEICYEQQQFLYHDVKPFSELKGQLEKWNAEGRYLLGHNTEGFDFPVLGYMGLEDVLDEFQIEGRSIDTKRVLNERYNLRISLQKIVDGTLGDSKSMKGSDAPIFWGQAKYDDVISYCVKDTRLTYRVWAQGREHGKITLKELDLLIEW